MSYLDYEPSRREPRWTQTELDRMTLRAALAILQQVWTAPPPADKAALIAKREERESRRLKMLEMRSYGFLLQEIADEFSVSKQRVHQILRDDAA